MCACMRVWCVDLAMRNCSQPGIGDAALTHLAGIRFLNMSGCTQATFTGASFAHLQGILFLAMSGCSSALVAAARGCLGAAVLV